MSDIANSTPFSLQANASLRLAASSSAAGSSSQPFGMGAVEAALPTYDRPPEYEDVSEQRAGSGEASKVDIQDALPQSGKAPFY